MIAQYLDERGPLTSAVERVAVVHRLAEQLVGYGFSTEQIIFDPITLPIVRGPELEITTLDTMTVLRREFPTVSVLCAVGNFGYALSNRSQAEAVYALAAQQAWADVFLCNVLDKRLTTIV